MEVLSVAVGQAEGKGGKTWALFSGAPSLLEETRPTTRNDAEQSRQGCEPGQEWELPLSEVGAQTSLYYSTDHGML